MKNPNFLHTRLDTLNVKHKFNTFLLDSEVAMSKSFLDKIQLNFIGFTDNYGSKENRFIIKPAFNFDFGKTNVKAKFGVDYMNSSFDKTFLYSYPISNQDYSIEKSNLIFTGHPSFTYVKDDLSIDIGAEVAYFSRMKDVYNGFKYDFDNKLYVYPKIKLSYILVKDIMVFFAGAEGGLKQNTHQNLTAQNKYLSPTLLLEPTDNQFNIYGGLRGKLANTVSYNLKAGIDSSRNLPLFKTNPYLSVPSEAYSYENSFNIVYDNVKTLTFAGELKS